LISSKPVSGPPGLARKGPRFRSLARNQCEVAACHSLFPVRLFELEEVNVTTGVAGDQFVIVDEGTGIRRAITSKRDERCSTVQVPHLQRFVLRRGHRPLRIRHHRHGIDIIRVAFQSAHDNAALQIPHP